MTKKDIVIGLAKELNLTQVEVKQIVQGVFDAIIDVLVQDRRIELRNFGVFEVKRRNPRMARNPKTGVQVAVPSKFRVTFKPGRKLELKLEKLQEKAEKPERPSK